MGVKRLLVLSILSFYPVIGSAEVKEPKQPSANTEKETGPIEFLSPGMIAYRNNAWIGSDHLYNLTDHIPVIVEIVNPPKEKLELSSGKLTDVVQEIFKKAYITPETTNSPPLPFFNVLIMIQPFEDFYAVYISGRLFEHIKVNRVMMQGKAYLQGITWERQELLTVPKGQLDSEVLSNVKLIAKQFTGRYKFFERLRVQKERHPL